MNGLQTASCLLKGRGCGKKPCDTDTRNERSVGSLALVLVHADDEVRGITWQWANFQNETEGPHQQSLRCNLQVTNLQV